MIKYISLFDIMNNPAGSKLVREGTEEDFINLLWVLGFDTNKPIERQECYHRPVTRKTNEPIFGMRFVGTERTDDEWRKSGKWSLDARLEEYRLNNFELYKELFQMSYTHNFTGEILNHMINKGSLLSYYGQMNEEELNNDDN